MGKPFLTSLGDTLDLVTGNNNDPVGPQMPTDAPDPQIARYAKGMNHDAAQNGGDPSKQHTTEALGQSLLTKRGDQLLDHEMQTVQGLVVPGTSATVSAANAAVRTTKNTLHTAQTQSHNVTSALRDYHHALSVYWTRKQELEKSIADCQSQLNWTVWFESDRNGDIVRQIRSYKKELEQVVQSFKDAQVAIRAKADGHSK